MRKRLFEILQLVAADLEKLETKLDLIKLFWGEGFSDLGVIKTDSVWELVSKISCLEHKVQVRHGL
jgi:hypothetical protein